MSHIYPDRRPDTVVSRPEPEPLRRCPAGSADCPCFDCRWHRTLRAIGLAHPEPFRERHAR